MVDKYGKMSAEECIDGVYRSGDLEKLVVEENRTSGKVIPSVIAKRLTEIFKDDLKPRARITPEKLDTYFRLMYRSRSSKFAFYVRNEVLAKPENR